MSNRNQRKRMYRVNLGFPPGLTRSVFIRARRRDIAETRALRQNPGSHIVRSPFSQD